MSNTYLRLTYVGKTPARDTGAVIFGDGNGCRLIRSNGIILKRIRINNQIQKEQIKRANVRRACVCACARKTS